MGIKNGGIDISDAVKGGSTLANKLDEPINKINELVDSLEKLDKKKDISTKIKPKVDTSELKKIKYEIGNGIELNVNTKLSKKDENQIKNYAKRITGIVEKQFENITSPSYDSIKELLHDIPKGQSSYITRQLNTYRDKMQASGITVSDDELEIVKQTYIDIRKVRNEIENLYNGLDKDIENIKFSERSISSVSDKVKQLYNLRLVLSELNKPGVTQITEGNTIKWQDQEKNERDFKNQQQDIINKVLEKSGFQKFIDTSNTNGSISRATLENVQKKLDNLSKIKKSENEEQKKAKDAQKELDKSLKKSDKAFQKMADIRKTSEQNPKTSKDYLQRINNKNLKSIDELSERSQKTFIGHYFAYKKSGRDLKDVDLNGVFDQWIQELSQDVKENEFLPYIKAAEEVFSISEEELDKKLAEIESRNVKTPKIDTKPVEKSEEKIREEVQKTDKAIEDSKKKREKTSSKNNNQENSKYLKYAKPDKTYSEDEWNYAKSRQIPYKLELGKDFTTEDAKKSKKQVLDTYKLYNEFLEREKLDTYLGTIAEYRFFKSYSDAASKGIQFQFDDEITDNGYLNSKLSNGSYAWEKKLKLSKARLLMYASVNDQIENADKSIFKQINLSDDIQRLVYHMFISKYHKDNDVRSINLEQAVEAQNDINQIIEKATGKKNVLTVVSADSIPVNKPKEKPKVESKSKEDNKPKVESKPKEKPKKDTKPKEDNKPKIESKPDGAKKSPLPQSTQTPKPESKQEKKPKETPGEATKLETKKQPPISTPTVIPQPSDKKPIEQAKDHAEALNEVSDAADKAAESVDKLDDKTKKAGKSAEKTQKDVKKENEQFNDTQKQATAAATAKLDFDSANQKVADGAEKSTKKIRKERKELEGISESDVLNKLGEYDKLTTVENGSGDVTSYTGSVTKKTDSAYVTTTQKYKANEDGDFELSYTSTTEDTKKFKNEVAKDSVLQSNVELAIQSLAEFEAHLKNVSKLSPDVKKKIDDLFNAYANVKSADDFKIANNMFKLLKQSEKNLNIDSANFAETWNKYLELMRETQGNEFKISAEKIDKQLGIGVTKEGMPTEKDTAFLEDTKKKAEAQVDKVIGVISTIIKLNNALKTELSKSPDIINNSYVEGLKKLIKKNEDIQKTLEGDELFKYRKRYVGSQKRNQYDLKMLEMDRSKQALKDQEAVNDNKKSILETKKNIGYQQLDELEKRLSNSSRLSGDIKQKISEARSILSNASSDNSLGVFNSKLSELRQLEKAASVDTNNFASNWDKWLSIIDRNNASQNFGNVNLPTESNSAFNDIDAISEYITNKVKQATNLSKNISKLQNDLSREISKPADQQNSQIIKDLEENITSDKKSLESIISNDLFKDKDKFISKDITNAYRDAELNLRKSSDNLKNTEDNQKIKKPIIDQYDAAIQKIKELKAAQDSLFNLQQKNAINPFDDYTSEIDKAKEKVNSLKTEVDSFYKSDFISKNANIIGEDKVKAYQKLYDDTVLNSDKHNNDLVDAMLNAYDKMRTAENKALNLSGRKDSNVLGADIEQQIIKMEGYRTSFEKLKNEVTEVYGETFQKDAIKDLEYYWNNKTNDSLMGNNNALFKELDNFSSKIKSFGSLANQARNDIASIQQELGKTTSSYNGDPLKYYEDMMNVRQKAISTMSFWKDGLGGKALSVESQLSELQKLENVVGKIPSYQANLNSFGETLSNILTGYNDKSISKEDAVKRLEELSNKIKEFSKNSSAFDKVNKKGTLISGTEGIVSNSKDVVAGLKEYAAQMQLGKELSTKINTTSGTVTMQFEGQNGAVTTLTGSIEAYNNALRVLNTQQSGAASSMKTFTGALKSIAGGTMKDVLGMLSSYFSGYKIMSTMMNQIQQGFTTLKAYDDSMTTISYTMNMTQSQLDSLGSSAINMAKDLSMSLDNAMSIYQIYANMNTTAQEIQETAKPTAILSNLSGVDTATAADQVQGILQQFNMLEDGSVSAADASMHVVDVLDKISSNVAIDYAKGIKVISDAVQASGQVAYDAGMTYEQLAAVTAKVAERTREDGGTIGNAIKTIVTRISKVGKMPQYASDVSNEELSNASKSLHEVGIEVYNTDGSFRELDVVLGELSAKWDTLSDAQQSNISYNVAATRQSSKFKNILTAWTDAMDLATEATETNGNALANQQKYEESFTGKTTAIKTQMDEFWLSFYDSAGAKSILDFVLNLTEGFTNLAQAIGPVKTLFMSIFGLSLGRNTLKTAFSFLTGGSKFKNAVGQPNPGCYSRYN